MLCEKPFSYFLLFPILGKGSRARALYKAGLRTPLAIAEASVTEIVKAMFDSSAWTHQGDFLFYVIFLQILIISWQLTSNIMSTHIYSWSE